MTKTILIAEDDKFIANAYRVKFQKEGFNVLIAGDGKELIEILEQEKTPDLIILDLIMPVQNGFETLAIISKNKNWNNIPIIVTSNLGQDSDIEKAKKLGAKDYFIKSESSLAEILNKTSKYL